MSIFVALAMAVSGPCPMPPGWNEIAARKTRFVVFGEMHGIRQSPEMFGDIACALASRREHILVALEQNATDDAALQKLWESDDKAFAEAIPKALEWQGRNDGISSRAMLAMLVRLHTLKTQGAMIDVVAFNGARDGAQRDRFETLPGQGPHEAAQADNIRHAADADRYDHVLILVGNLHASKQPVTRGGTTWQPMAMRLAPSAEVTTLNIMFGSGTTWNCMGRPGFHPVPGKPITSDAIECGAHDTKGDRKLKRGRFLALGTPPGSEADPGYDGYFWVGPAVASPPALK